MISAINNGRASIKPTGEEDVYIPCDVLVVAVGQNIETKHLRRPEFRQAAERLSQRVMVL